MRQYGGVMVDISMTDGSDAHGRAKAGRRSAVKFAAVSGALAGCVTASIVVWLLVGGNRFGDTLRNVGGGVLAIIAAMLTLGFLILRSNNQLGERMANLEAGQRDANAALRELNTRLGRLEGNRPS